MAVPTLVYTREFLMNHLKALERAMEMAQDIIPPAGTMVQGDLTIHVPMDEDKIRFIVHTVGSILFHNGWHHELNLKKKKGKWVLYYKCGDARDNEAMTELRGDQTPSRYTITSTYTSAAVDALSDDENPSTDSD